MKPLTYATVCSGIECMSVAARGLPLIPVFFSEIEPFPCAVLKAHYPNVPNLGDMSRITIKEGIASNGRTDVTIPGGRLDILAGGTPCQDVSIAGLRRGMQEGSGTRSSLAFEFVRLIREAKPRFVLWENVDGVRSDPSFPGFLRAIGECGYSVAYRVLDAQYVRCTGYDDPHYAHAGVDGMERAIPQRRRRVWVVGCLGADDLAAARILFEHDCMCGNHPPRRRTRQEARLAAGERAGVHDRVVGSIQNNLIGRTAVGPCGQGVRTDGAAFTLDTTVGGGGVAITRGQSFDGGFGFPTADDDVSLTIHNNTCPGYCNGVVTDRNA